MSVLDLSRYSGDAFDAAGETFFAVVKDLETLADHQGFLTAEEIARYASRQQVVTMKRLSVLEHRTDMPQSRSIECP